MRIRNTGQLMAVALCVWLSRGYVRSEEEGEAVLRFANIFNSHMVLQRERPLKVWGWAKPGDNVTVTLTAETAVARSVPPPAPPAEAEEPSYKVEITYREEDAAPFKAVTASAVADGTGLWEAELPALAASFQPKSLIARSGAEEVVLEDILVGELWVTAGQSNMAWGGNRTAWLDNKGLLTTGVRYAHTGKHSSYKVPADLGGRSVWKPCTEENIGNIATIPHLFGRYLHRLLRMPVGIINAASGGALANYWSSAEELHAIDHWVVKEMMAEHDAAIAEWENAEKRAAIVRRYEEEYAAAKQKWEAEVEAAKAAKKRPPKEPPYRPPKRPQSKHLAAHLYNGRIVPIGRLAVRGVLYLQGEQQVLTWKYDQYEHVLPAVIRSFRAAFGNDALPFGIISLQGAGHNRLNQGAVDSVNRTALVRDIQWRTHAATTNTGFICSHDVGRGLHPSWKRPVAERAVHWAMRDVYKQIKNEHPSVERVEFADGRAFVHVVQNRVRKKRGPGRTMIEEKMKVPAKIATWSGNDSCYLDGFVIAGADRRWYPAKMFPDKGKKALKVWSDLVPEPVALRYGWGSYPQANIGPWEDPLPPFRTDDWPLPRSHRDEPGEDFDARSAWYGLVAENYDVVLDGRIRQGRFDAAVCELKLHDNAVAILQSKADRMLGILSEMDHSLYAGDKLRQTDHRDWLFRRQDEGRLGRAGKVSDEMRALLQNQAVRQSIADLRAAVESFRDTVGEAE